MHGNSSETKKKNTTEFPFNYYSGGAECGSFNMAARRPNAAGVDAQSI